jgi:HemX, putative uroporphyrinogen-III C-methyltransferase
MESVSKMEKDPKRLKSDALSQGLWKALWIALAVCITWLGIEGGFRLYHRPAKLDARVTELEAQLAAVTAHEAELELTLKGSLEAERSLAPVAERIADLINKSGNLPMNALPSPSGSSPAVTGKNNSLVEKIFKEVQSVGDKLIRIQVVGDASDVALTPAAQDLIRQQLKLHLVSARMAWLSRMPSAAKEDIQQVEKLLAKHYLAQSPAVIAFQKTTHDLALDIGSSSSSEKKGR